MRVQSVVAALAKVQTEMRQQLQTHCVKLGHPLRGFRLIFL